MTESDRIKYLRVALFIVGLIFTFGIWPLTIVWQSGWAWHAGGRAEYLEMILGVLCYARRVLDDCLTRSNGQQEPHLVHGLVQFRAWGNHGCSVRR